MTTTALLQEAASYQEQLVRTRRFLHTHPGTGFDIQETVDYVKQELISMGYEPQMCGKSGIVALAGGKKDGKVFLIRGDMDALPMKEEADVSFPSTNGKMHACGHDMHTMMIHVMAGLPLPAGTVISCDGGVSAPAADYFYIDIQGKGCHGSMPNNGVDPVTVAAHIITGLQEIHARELGLSDEAILTIGTVNAGNAANVIPDTAHMSGTIRTYDESTRAFIKQRVSEIASGIATAFRATATVTYGSGCPCLYNNPDLAVCTADYLKELLGPSKAFTASALNAMSGEGKAPKSTGSEDFAYVSQEVPSIMFALAAGTPQEGYCYPQHHPKVKFDEAVLSEGCAVYAYTAMRWLTEHKN